MFPKEDEKHTNFISDSDWFYKIFNFIIFNHLHQSLTCGIGYVSQLLNFVSLAFWNASWFTMYLTEAFEGVSYINYAAYPSF